MKSKRRGDNGRSGWLQSAPATINGLHAQRSQPSSRSLRSSKANESTRKRAASAAAGIEESVNASLVELMREKMRGRRGAGASSDG